MTPELKELMASADVCIASFGAGMEIMGAKVPTAAATIAPEDMAVFNATGESAEALAQALESFSAQVAQAKDHFAA